VEQVREIERSIEQIIKDWNVPPAAVQIVKKEIKNLLKQENRAGKGFFKEF